MLFHNYQLWDYKHIERKEMLLTHEILCRFMQRQAGTYECDR